MPPSVKKEPITGRVYFMVARTDEREPRLQIGRTGTPFFGRDVENLAPGQAAIIDATDLGTPVASLKDLPPGDYFVQAFVNVYSEFKRADGHTVWMHDDQWEGQHWNVSPGNLYSKPQKIRIDSATEPIKLVADQVIPAITVPADTEFVKRIKIQSTLLTKFWGRPIYLGATVLLPRDYATLDDEVPDPLSPGPLLARTRRSRSRRAASSTRPGCATTFRACWSCRCSTRRRTSTTATA